MSPGLFRKKTSFSWCESTRVVTLVPSDAPPLCKDERRVARKYDKAGIKTVNHAKLGDTTSTVVRLLLIVLVCEGDTSTVRASLLCVGGMARGTRCATCSIAQTVYCDAVASSCFTTPLQSTSLLSFCRYHLCCCDFFSSYQSGGIFFSHPREQFHERQKRHEARRQNKHHNSPSW